MPRGEIEMDTPKKRPGGSRYVKKAGAAGERLAAAARRIQAADDYLNGKSTIAELAKEHGMAVKTIRDWVQARSRETLHARDPAKAGFKQKIRKDLEYSSLEHGSGGRMCDAEIRNVTRALEVAIVALQAKLGLRTFPYRQRSDGGW
jgi:transposase-like protein